MSTERIQIIVSDDDNSAKAAIAKSILEKERGIVIVNANDRPAETHYINPVPTMRLAELIPEPKSNYISGKKLPRKKRK